MISERRAIWSSAVVATITSFPFMSQSVLAQTLVRSLDSIGINDNRPQYQGFVLENLDASLELNARHEIDKSDPEAGSTIEDKETRFREELGLRLDSYIGHPNLFDLTADLRFRLEQKRFESDSAGGTSNDNDLTLLFDVEALIFGATSSPWTIYARRDQYFIDQQFGSSIDSTRTEIGTQLLHLTDRSRTRFEYFHRELEQSGSDSFSDYSNTEDTFTVESNISITQLQKLNLAYNFTNVDQAGARGGGLPKQATHSFDGTHLWTFGPLNENNLRSSIEFSDLSNDVDRQTFRWFERLRLKHSTTLNSRYDGTYRQETHDGLDRSTLRGTASVFHRWYQSVTTSATLGGERNEIDNDLDNESFFGNVFFDYTKRVPYGTFDGSLNVASVNERNGERGESLSIQNEPHRFNDPFPIVLNRRDIEANSITVTDSADVLVYIEGVDYTVQSFSDRTEIRRVVGGAIADGELVLIDYIVGPTPSSEIDSTAYSVSARYTLSEGPLSGLGVYGRYRETNQNVDSVDPRFFTLQEVRSLTYGADYRNRGLYLLVEREHRDSDVSPFDSTRLEAIYTQRIDQYSAFSLDGRYDIIDFTDDNNRVESARIQGTWSQRLKQNVSANLKLIYLDTKDDVGGDSTGFEQKLELRWRRHQTSFKFIAENKFLDNETEDNTFQRFELSISRSF